MILKCKKCGKKFKSFNYKHLYCDKCLNETYAKASKKLREDD